MTDLKRSIFVVPTTTLEDMPVGMGHDLAVDFLNAWTATWDPRILAALQCLPEWKRADSSALDTESALIVIPAVSTPKVDRPLRERLELGQNIVVDSQAEWSRDHLVKALLQAFDDEPSHPTPVLCQDFYALGYAVHQIQILARKLRYSWNIDWIVFSELVLSAAKASLADDEVETERWIQAAFDALSQERDRYCSQQSYLLDVVLTAPTTLGPSLQKQLTSSHSLNLMASADILRSLQEKNPATSEQLKQLVASKTISIVGGLDRENEHRYLSSAAIVRDLSHSLRAYSQLGYMPPKVFARFTPGYIAGLPAWLTQFGYTGSLLASWSGGTIPDKEQAKLKWQATSDGKTLDTLLGHVLDAANAESYLDLAHQFSKQMDYHQVPTLVMAHWPGLQLQALEDLQRVVARTPALGRFVTAEDYFATTSQPYSSDCFSASSFRVPTATEVDAQQAQHRSIIEYQQLRVQAERLWSLFHLWKQVALSSSKGDLLGQSLEHELHGLLLQIDRTVSDASSDQSTERLQQSLHENRQALLRLIPQILKTSATTAQDGDNAREHNYLLVNPSSHTMRLHLDDLEGCVDSNFSSRIFASESHGSKSRTAVDIPPFGFVGLKASAKNSAAQTPITHKRTPLWKKIAGGRSGIAESDWTLANEFVEVQIDPKRGHLRSVYVANQRGSLMSGMVSIVDGPADVKRKWNDNDCLPTAQTELQVIESTSMVGVIQSKTHHQKKDGSSILVTCRYTLRKGSRWIDVSVDVNGLPRSQYGCVWRTAWLNEGASLSAWYHGIKGKLQSPLQAAVELLEIEDSAYRIYLAPRGLSMHMRAESRFLVTHLPQDDQGNVRSRFSIGLNLARPYEAALDLLDSPWLIPGVGGLSEANKSGAWLAQCDLPNVEFSWDSPTPSLAPADLPTSDREVWTGQAGDACIWIHETLGKSGTAKLSFFQDVAEAWRVDMQGREFDALSVVNGEVIVHVRANEQSRLLLRWKSS